MEITVVIDDAMLEEPVRKAVASAVNMEVRNRVNQKIAATIGAINDAIDKYLSSNLPDDKLKSLIDTEVRAQLADRIRSLDD